MFKHQCVTLIMLVLGAFAGAGASAQSFTADLTSGEPIGISQITVVMEGELIARRSSHIGWRRGDMPVHPVDAERLIDELDEDLTKAFDNRGLIDPAANAVLTVTITNVKPTNPGFTRNGASMGISPNGSAALGGATLEGQIVGGDGAVLARFSYESYDRFLDETLARGGWTRAHRTFRSFARRTADAVAAG